MDNITDVYIYFPIEALSLIEAIKGFVPYALYYKKDDGETTSEWGKVKTEEGILHFVIDPHLEHKLPLTKADEISKLEYLSNLNQELISKLSRKDK